MKKDIQQQGKEYHKLLKTGQTLSRELNDLRIQLGMILIGLKSCHDSYQIKENYGTFDQCLSTLQLTPRQAKDLIWNAEYLIECSVPSTVWKDIPLNKLRLLRKVKINPLDGECLEDMVILSYKDFSKKYV